MNERRTWLILLALVVVVIVLVFVGHPGSPSDSPDHRSTSDARNGTSALKLYAEALGHHADAVEASFTIPQDAGLIFVFRPTSRPLTGDDASTLLGWVERGGVLVYASEERDVSLESAFNLSRQSGLGPAQAEIAAPVLTGVQQLHGGAIALPFLLSPQQVAVLRNHEHAVLGLMAAVGQGRVIALADPLPLCNGYLEQPDNGRFAADLLSMSNGAVVFDEYHHGAAAGETDWLTTPWGGALGWAAFVVFVGMALRGRGFGPRLPLVPSTDRSTAEYARAVGSLLGRTGARQETLGVLAAGARRAVAERLGLGRDVQDRRFREMLARRAPDVAARLANIETRTPTAVTDREVFEVSRELHELAYPVPAPLPSPSPEERGDLSSALPNPSLEGSGRNMPKESP